LWNLDLVNPRRVTNAEIHILPIEPNPQLIVKKRLCKRLFRNLCLLSEDYRWNRWRKLGRRLCPGDFFLGQEQGAP